MTATPILAKGAIVVVVGPSGAGKDSVMAYAEARCAGDAGILFAKRLITRAADAGGEVHDAISKADFDSLKAARAFAVSWEAHGLNYAIPAETISAVAQGTIVIANGSRAALADFKAAYPRVVVVQITAAPEILAQRLAHRGRETPDSIKARLQRPAPALPDGLDIRTIDNSADLATAGEDFLSIIRSLR
jgi:ribose 1,5-bisphosphokinase